MEMGGKGEGASGANGHVEGSMGEGVAVNLEEVCGEYCRGGEEETHGGGSYTDDKGCGFPISVPFLQKVSGRLHAPSSPS